MMRSNWTSTEHTGEGITVSHRSSSRELK